MLAPTHLLVGVLNVEGGDDLHVEGGRVGAGSLLRVVRAVEVVACRGGEEREAIVSILERAVKVVACGGDEDANSDEHQIDEDALSTTLYRGG